LVLQPNSSYLQGKHRSMVSKEFDKHYREKHQEDENAYHIYEHHSPLRAPN